VVDWGGGVCCSCSIALLAPLALANQLPLPAIVERSWSWHRRVSSTMEESDLFTILHSTQHKIGFILYVLPASLLA